MAFKDPVKIPQVTTTSDFINKANPTDLSGLSLNELADRYEQIERQGQLLQGIILLEVRNRFKSDNDFGDWVKNIMFKHTTTPFKIDEFSSVL